MLYHQISIIPYHNGMKLETSDRSKTEKFPNMRKLNNTFTHEQSVGQTIKQIDIKKYLETTQSRNRTYQNL